MPTGWDRVWLGPGACQGGAAGTSAPDVTRSRIARRGAPQRGQRRHGRAGAGGAHRDPGADLAVHAGRRTGLLLSARQRAFKKRPRPRAEAHIRRPRVPRGTCGPHGAPERPTESLRPQPPPAARMSRSTRPCALRSDVAVCDQLRCSRCLGNLPRTRCVFFFCRSQRGLQKVPEGACALGQWLRSGAPSGARAQRRSPAPAAGPARRGRRRSSCCASCSPPVHGAPPAAHPRRG